MKKFFSLVFIAALSSSVFCQSGFPVLGDFHAEGSGIKEQKLDSYPLSIKAEPSQELVLKGTLSLPDGWHSGAGIILYKNLMSCSVYVNDVLIETIGRSGENFFFQPYITRGVFIPAQLLKTKNEVKLILWNDTGTYKIRMLTVEEPDVYEKKMRLYSFLDIQLPRFACILLLFVALYSLFMYINYRAKKEFCYLACAAAFFSVYLLNVTVYDSNVPYLLMKSLLYSCFPASMIFVILFFRRFLDIKTKKMWKWALFFIGLIFVAGYYLMRNTAALDAWHSVMLVYPVITLVYGTVGFICSLKKTGVQNIGTGVGLAAAVVCSGYDMYNYMLDITPFILLQGIGFMALIIGIFFSISQEIADTDRKCVLYSGELQKNKDRSESVIEHVRSASEKADSAGKMLDGSIAAVGSLVSQYLVSTNQVNSNLATQHEQVQTNKETVMKIFTSIDKTAEMVDRHEKLVDVTVTDVNNMTEGIHRTDELMKKTSETISELTGVCTAADKDVTESLAMVDDLASYSKNIYEIVNSISELSQQTNVLSINAAIEAARSGAEGKGFSVVSSEIRSLATQSGDNAGKISLILSTMVDKIKNIQMQEALVSSRLKDVIVENSKTEDGIHDILSVLNRQLEQSSHITSVISELVDTVHSISEQTAGQRKSGESLNQSLELLTKITEEVYSASKEQMQCNEELRNNLSTMHSASENNVGVISELRMLVDQKQN